MKSMFLFVAFAVALPLLAQPKADKSHGPDCSGRWPTIMTFVHLKNAGLTDNDKIDSSKTKTVRLASEKIGKKLFRQVYYVTFTEKSGHPVEAIAVHNASTDECSMSGVEVFVVSRHLNPEGR